MTIAKCRQIFGDIRAKGDGRRLPLPMRGSGGGGEKATVTFSLFGVARGVQSQGTANLRTGTFFFSFFVELASPT